MIELRLIDDEDRLYNSLNMYHFIGFVERYFARLRFETDGEL